MDLRVAGDVPTDAATLAAGSVAPEAPTVLLIDGAQTVSVAPAGDIVVGIWSSHPAVAALARAALQSLS